MEDSEQTTQMSLASQVESILFWKGEPMSFGQLAKILDVKISDISTALDELQEHLSREQRGIAVVREGTQATLATNAQMADKIQALQKEELTKDLSKAALETLSIVLYRGPIKRSEIDFIRGVNSQFSLRALAIRGLIEKAHVDGDERAYTYSPSLQLLQLLGVDSKETLPDYEIVNDDIESFIAGADQPEDKVADEQKDDTLSETHAGTSNGTA